MEGEADRAAEVLERILVDPAFRVRFRQDPSATCREAGLDDLAAEIDHAALSRKAMHTLADRRVALQPGRRDDGRGGGGHRRRRVRPPRRTAARARAPSSARRRGPDPPADDPRGAGRDAVDSARCRALGRRRRSRRHSRRGAGTRCPRRDRATGQRVPDAGAIPRARAARRGCGTRRGGPGARCVRQGAARRSAGRPRCWRRGGRASWRPGSAAGRPPARSGRATRAHRASRTWWRPGHRHHQRRWRASE